MKEEGIGMNNLHQLKNELAGYADSEKAAFLPNFFRAVPGGYGEGDDFIGVSVPYQRKVAKQYFNELHLDEIEQLLQDPVHECRLTALFMMIYRFENSKLIFEKEEIVSLYLNNLDYVNNWDLVDSSAYKLLGAYLQDRSRVILDELAASGHLWRQRVAVIATLYFIRNNDYSDTLRLAEKLLHHPHDLIHKAVGWMLREVGNRNLTVELTFLDQYYQQMPRTMLRYAIEKMDHSLRSHYLKKYQ